MRAIKSKAGAIGSAAVAVGTLLSMSIAHGGVIPADREVVSKQVIFADTFDGDTYSNSGGSLAGDTGGYKDWLGQSENEHNISSAAGPLGASSDVLKIKKKSNFRSAPGLRAYFATSCPVNPQKYELNYTPDKSGNQYLRLSYDWKPVSGGKAASDSFSTVLATESKSSSKFGQTKILGGTYAHYNKPLKGWHLYASPGNRSPFSNGGNGEVYSTGQGPNELLPDGRWYHIAAEFSLPDADGKYKWSTIFTPYDPATGKLLTEAAATESGEASCNPGDYFAFLSIAGKGGTGEYEWWLDNLKAELITLGEPAANE